MEKNYKKIIEKIKKFYKLDSELTDPQTVCDDIFSILVKGGVI